MTYTNFSDMYHKANHYLPMAAMQDGGLYWIIARNASIGIWCECARGFVISRHKGSENYLFIEYHWDTYCADTFPYGTAKPFELIETTGFDLAQLVKRRGEHPFSSHINYEADNYDAVLDYLNAKAPEYSCEQLIAKFGKPPAQTPEAHGE